MTPEALSDRLRGFVDLAASNDDSMQLWVPTRAVDLISTYPNLRPSLVEGLLRRGENMNFIAPPKAGKSWLVTDLALAVATGRNWLGRFKTDRQAVLVLDNELHCETSASRIPKVAAARGILSDEYAETLFVENLRGRRIDLPGLRKLFRHIERGRFGMVVLDAWYRFLPIGSNENDNGTQADLFNLLDTYAHDLGASFVVIHHSSKGIQGNKSVVDVGAGAGAMARATDSHFILREHMEDGAVVIDAAVRSWAPLQPFVARYQFPVFVPDDTLDPTQLRVERRRGGSTLGRQGESKEAPAITWTPDEFVRRLINADGRTKDEILVDAEAQGLSAKKSERLLGAAVAKRLAHKWAFGRAVKERFSTDPHPPLIPGIGAPKAKNRKG